jgi:phosphoenolpyruvate carboxykinase (ATP)
MAVAELPRGLDRRYDLTPSRENLSTAQLVRDAVRNGEGRVLGNGTGPLAIDTEKTGRSLDKKYLVCGRNLWYEGGSNRIDEVDEHQLYADVQKHLAEQPTYEQELSVGADPMYSAGIVLKTPRASAALFGKNLFRPDQDTSQTMLFPRQFRIYHAPDFYASRRHGAPKDGDTAVVVNFEDGRVIIAGSDYPGEIKKAIFTMMQYHLLRLGVLPMHCSATEGALFFGLSGTGKTTLSMDSNRRLIGDDEHGWTDQGIFNLEGGIYAKAIGLDEAKEPIIFHGAKQFGSILENVIVREDGSIDFASRGHKNTENTRAAISMEHIENAAPSGLGNHPTNIIFVSYDAYGFLPPVARLTPEQAYYHFLAGYTSRVGGTVQGVDGVQPEFSACFGKDFLPLKPERYGEMFYRNILKHDVSVWWVNTGNNGQGKRYPLEVSRAVVNAIQNGEVGDFVVRDDDRFMLQVPMCCRGVDPALLDPRNSFASEDEFRSRQDRGVREFTANFQQFSGTVSQEVLAAGPH